MTGAPEAASSPLAATTRTGATGVRRLSRWDVCVRLLDRPGGRRLLGLLATARFRRTTSDDVGVSYNFGLWTRRTAQDFFPDGPKFEYVHVDFSDWKMQMGRYAADTNEYWLRHYQPSEGDVIIDIGAGRGEDTFTFSRGVGRSGRVIAIEADPLSFKILRNFCKLNQLANVTPLHAAVMDTCGTVRIAQTGSSWLENSIDSRGGSRGAVVGATTFEELSEREQLHEIAFLKMNIEGAEHYALAGMGRALAQVRHICVACHDFRAELGHGEEFRTRAFVEEFLRGAGFEVVSRPDDPRDYVRDHIFGLRRA